MMAQILGALASISWIMETGIISILLFGEYPYPSEDDTETN